MLDREISPSASLISGWNFNPEGEIYLSYMDWLKMDYLSPTISELKTKGEGWSTAN